MSEQDQTLGHLENLVSNEGLLANRSDGAANTRVIVPGATSLPGMARDLWRSRELLYFLTWRDIRVRYKQTALGASWAIMQPVISMIVLSLVFGRLSGISKNTGGVPYPIFLYSGLLPWTFFASTVASSSSSVVGNAALIGKIRFPRIALPISAMAGELVDFCLAFFVLLGLMAWYHVPLTLHVLMMPFLVAGIAMIAVGLGSLFSALTVKYRDFRFIIPFMMQIWMYLTPIIYPAQIIPPKFRAVLALNPLTGWITGFRSAFLGFPINWFHIGEAAVTSFMFLAYGVWYFQSKERRFAEII